MAKFMITSIDWETDGEEVSLPTEELVDGADDGDAAVDALSDKYGWLIKNCGGVQRPRVDCSAHLRPWPVLLCLRLWA